jgi:hypothetical protein
LVVAWKGKRDVCSSYHFALEFTGNDLPENPKWSSHHCLWKSLQMIIELSWIMKVPYFEWDCCKEFLFNTVNFRFYASITILIFQNIIILPFILWGYRC